MCQDIPFNKVMKDPKSWDDEMDIDIMSSNYLKLEPIIDKMFFQGYPEHPQYFSLLFSKPEFADSLIEGLINSEVSEHCKIYFKEYSKEDRMRLIKMGIFELIPSMFGLACVVQMKSGDDYFVCLVL